jgi:hypothetical protein
VCVFITAGPSTKLFTRGGGGDVIHTRTHFKGCAFSRLPVCGATPLCGFPPIVCAFIANTSLSHTSLAKPSCGESRVR